MPAGMEATRDHVTKFVLGIVGLVISIQLVPVALDALNVTGLPALLSATIVGLLIGAGILFYAIDTFF